MTYPVFEGFTKSADVETSTLVIDMPVGVVSGDILLIFLAAYSASQDLTLPTGWTLASGSGRSANPLSFSIYEKVSDGTETTATITTELTSVTFVAYAVRISGVDELEYSESATQANSASVNFVTAPTITPSWGGDTLYLVAGASGRGGSPFGTTPASYTSETGVSGKNSNNKGTGLMFGHREGASAEESPGDLVCSTYNEMEAITIAVKGSGPVPPSITLTNGDLEPGKAITGTASNFTSAPTALTATDADGNSISSASEITDLVVTSTGGESYDIAFTMPDRITTGTGTTLLRGDITVELT